MSHQNDEETRSRGRPVTPEADLRAALAEATLTLLLKGLRRCDRGCGGQRGRGCQEDPLPLRRQSRRAGGAGGAQLDRCLPAGLRAGYRSSRRAGEMLVLGLQTIAGQVLSAPAVGMFRLLQHEFMGRDALLAAYQENGIARGRRRRWRRGYSASSNWAGCGAGHRPDQRSAAGDDHGEPLRQMALGLLAPGSDIRAHHRGRCAGAARDARVGVLPQRATSCHWANKGAGTLP